MNKYKLVSHILYFKQISNLTESLYQIIELITRKKKHNSHCAYKNQYFLLISSQISTTFSVALPINFLSYC